MNSGVFAARTGTVTFDGTAAQTITGSTTFYTFIKKDTLDNDTDVTLIFDNTAIQTITGSLTLDGIDTLDRVNLLSDSPGNKFDFSINSAQTATWLDVTDSEVSGTASITATDSLDSNTDKLEAAPHWIFSGGGRVGPLKGAVIIVD